FSQEFAKVQDPNETILCIHPSAEVSGTVRSATVAAQDFPNLDIRIIDTRVVGSPLATLVILAAKWAQEGVAADTIVERIKTMSQSCHIYFLVDTLEYMAKGGRIGNATALLGSVLQIKPILTFRDGKVDVFEKERTQKRARERLVNIVVEQIPKNQEAYLTLMHADTPNVVAEISRGLSSRLSINTIEIYEVPPAIITHAGPGVLGVAFFTQNF
ncbi:MAG: DegV family protein, partial [Anaerolineales bacterium]